MALSFLLTANFLSDSIFGDILGVLQTLAGSAGFLPLPTPYDAFPAVLAKAALLPSVIATLDKPQHAYSSSALRFPPHLRDSRSVWREVVEVAPHPSLRDLAPVNWCAYGARPAATLFLTANSGMLGPSWFAALGVLQITAYVFSSYHILIYSYDGLAG